MLDPRVGMKIYDNVWYTRFRLGPEEAADILAGIHRIANPKGHPRTVHVTGNLRNRILPDLPFDLECVRETALRLQDVCSLDESG